MKSKFVMVLGATLITLTGLIGLTQAQAGELHSSAAPQNGMGTGFTYQGQLKKDSALVNNTCDFRWRRHCRDWWWQAQQRE